VVTAVCGVAVSALVSVSALFAASAPALAEPAGPAASSALSAVTVDVATAAAVGAGSEVTSMLGDSAELAVRTTVAVAASALGLRSVKIPEVVVPAAPPAHWSGWVSGASGDEAADGRFARFRGRPVGIVSVWCDNSADDQTSLSAVDTYAGFRGQMDVSVGGLVSGETWDKAAAGAYVGRWTAAVRTLRAKRAGKGTTYIRIAHEFNGDWFPWGVDASNVAAYKKGYRLYASIVRKEFPQARLTWSPNGENHNTLSMDQMYPGPDVVDVIGPDDYDGWPKYTDASVWASVVDDWSAPNTPHGLDTWEQYAARKGKPLAMPEWGMQGGDHPAYIQGVHDFLRRYAARRGSRSVAGRVVYDVYFNAEDKFKLTNGQYPKASKLYASMAWGD
jgi:hypothetical protein